MEKTSSKIGVAIITYNRPDYFKQVVDSIPKEKIDVLIAVNDGDNHYTREVSDKIDFHILHKEQLGVAKTKNHALECLIEKYNCEHLFLIEDDIIIKDHNVFAEYIKAANSTGIHHLCYEKVANNEKTIKAKYEQQDGVKIGFYHNPQGAFMYINAQVVKKLGFFDESYLNAFEHVDFAYNLAKNRLMPPFWYFPDLLESEKYLTDIKGSSENSTITNKNKYKENWQKSAHSFVQKWGIFTNQIPDLGIKSLEEQLIFLQSTYSRKTLVNSNQMLSIIIPYRDREFALKQIVPFLQGYIKRQILNFEIIIVEQDNNKPFNKGFLNNIGYSLKNTNSTYVCFHDVDLIPEFSDYSFPEMPSHISSHCSQFKYNNIADKIMGGVILFQNSHFEKVNGFSNEYWGWGKEDDDLYTRCVKEDLEPYKHPLGRFYSIPHKHRLIGENSEKEYHEKNGQRYNDYLNGKLDNLYHKKDGLNSLPYYEIVEKKDISTNVTHYKVKI